MKSSHSKDVGPGRGINRETGLDKTDFVLIYPILFNKED